MMHSCGNYTSRLHRKQELQQQMHLQPLGDVERLDAHVLELPRIDDKLEVSR